MNELEILNFLKSHDNLDLVAGLEQQIGMVKRKEILARHHYKIFQDKEGYWRTTLPDGKGGRSYRRRKSLEDLEDLLIEYYKDEIGDTFFDVLNAWLDNKLEYNEIYKQTYDRYQTDSIRFFKDTAFGAMEIGKITEGMIEDFIRSSIIERGLSNKAYSNLRLLIRGTFKYAYKRQLTTINIETFFSTLSLSRKIFKKNYAAKEESVFTDSEVERIEEWIMSREPSLINYGILLAFYTGIRVGELSALTNQDVNGNLLTINKTEIRYRDDDGYYIFEVRNDAKTEAGNRTVILSDDAINILNKIRRMNPFGEYMFMKDGERIKEKAFTVKLYKICALLDIPKRSMHKARKTYATKLLNSNVSEALIIDQMGHTDINCTKNHYYFNNAEMEVAREQICNAISY